MTPTKSKATKRLTTCSSARRKPVDTSQIAGRGFHRNPVFVFGLFLWPDSYRGNHPARPAVAPKGMKTVRIANGTKIQTLDHRPRDTSGNQLLPVSGH